MPAETVVERFGQRRMSGTRGERAYVIKGNDIEIEEEDALALLLGEAPATLGSLVRDDDECEVEEVADNVYLGTAVYTGNEWEQQPVDSFHLSFDISGQPVRITQSRGTTVYEAVNTIGAIDFKGAINVNADGTVEGVDMLAPVFTYQVTYTKTDAAVTSAYINTLALLVGTVNNGTFHGFAAGELLFTRVSGEKRADGNWDLTYGFAVSRNETNINLTPNEAEEDDQLIVATKKGWEYLWVYYDWREYEYGTGSGTATGWRKVPLYAYVEKIYKESAYGALSI